MGPDQRRTGRYQHPLLTLLESGNAWHILTACRLYMRCGFSVETQSIKASGCYVHLCWVCGYVRTLFMTCTGVCPDGLFALKEWAASQENSSKRGWPRTNHQRRQGRVLRVGLPQPVAILPWGVKPGDCVSSAGCPKALAHKGDFGGVRPQPFMDVVL
jgi:ferredoxin